MRSTGTFNTPQSELSSESDFSDSEEERRPKSNGRKGSAGSGRSRNRDDSLSDDSGSEGDGRGGGPKGFDDDTFGTEGAKLAKQKRHRGKVFLFLD